MKSDVDNISEVLEGNTNKFEDIVDKYKDRLYTYLFYLTKDKDISEDLAQETFVKAYLNLKKYNQNKGQFYTWISKIAYNLFVDYKKKNNIVQLPINDETLQTDAYLDTDIDSHIISLKEMYREVILLKYYNGFTCEEIGNILNLSANTIKTRLSRAKSQLKSILEEEGVMVGE